jgi:hypothetical protein
MRTRCTRGVVSTAGLLLLLAITTPVLSVTGEWSPPFNLSEWQNGVYRYRLALGGDGTQAAFWQILELPSLQWSLEARVRPPGEPWGPPLSLTGTKQSFSADYPTIWNAGVAPDGTAWAVWAAIDTGQVGDNVQVWASNLPPGGSWQSEALTSGYETSVRWVDLQVGPDGDLAAAWVACASSTNPADGPCHVRVRRRPAGAPNWEPIEQPDQAVGVGMYQTHIAVGPGGLTVVLWEQADTSTPKQWAIMARAFEPASGTWDPGPTNVSGWKAGGGMAGPVMDPAGTVTVAWYAAASGDPAKWAIYANTRPAASGAWSGSPPQLSSANAGIPFDYSLAVGQNGTVAAIWGYEVTTTQHNVFASARDPASTWSAETQLLGTPGLRTDYFYLRLAVWPDGSVLALYPIQDTHRPTSDDERLHWIVRSPHGTWGEGGQGEVGDWMAFLSGLVLSAGGDGRAVVVWGPRDAGGPAGEQYTVLAAIWPPGGPFGPPGPLAEWYQLTEPDELIASPEGMPLAVAWWGQRTSDGASAVFYNELLGGGQRIYLPMILRG